MACMLRRRDSMSVVSIEAFRYDKEDDRHHNIHFSADAVKTFQVFHIMRKADHGDGR